MRRLRQSVQQLQRELDFGDEVPSGAGDVFADESSAGSVPDGQPGPASTSITDTTASATPAPAPAPAPTPAPAPIVPPAQAAAARDGIVDSDPRWQLFANVDSSNWYAVLAAAHSLPGRLQQYWAARALAVMGQPQAAATARHLLEALAVSGLPAAATALCKALLERL